MDLSVITPAYNEEYRIADTIQRVASYLQGRDHEIIVVNDGSTDSTPDILRRLTGEIRGLRLISYDSNMGKGYAVRQGMLAGNGRLLLMSDADLSAPIEELPKLEAALNEGAGIAFGSREIREVRQSFYREIGGKALNLAIQALALPGIWDTQCGFKLLTRECAQAVFPRCFLNGFSFDVEVLYLARRMGFKLAETPIRWSHKEGSKVNPIVDGLRFLRDLLKIRFHKYDFANIERVCGENERRGNSGQ